MSCIGFVTDHPLLDSDLVWYATQSLIMTRDGLLRGAAMPKPIGECFFVNDLTCEELDTALNDHNYICAAYTHADARINAYAESRE